MIFGYAAILFASALAAPFNDPEVNTALGWIPRTLSPVQGVMSVSQFPTKTLVMFFVAGALSPLLIAGAFLRSNRTAWIEAKNTKRVAVSVVVILFVIGCALGAWVVPRAIHTYSRVGFFARCVSENPLCLAVVGTGYFVFALYGFAAAMILLYWALTASFFEKQ